jgi:S1-C subfamily serine protease
MGEESDPSAHEENFTMMALNRSTPKRQELHSLQRPLTRRTLGRTAGVVPRASQSVTTTLRSAFRTGLPAFSLVAGLVLTAQVAPAQNPSTRDIAQRAEAATLSITSLDARGQSTGAGSGFFIRGDGVFVTNYHVIRGAQRLRVRLSSGTPYEEVELIATDPARDLAVLRVPVENAPVLPLGSDAAARMGDRVYAMGNPLGMERTFSDGLVSAQRTLEGISYLQISAPISPGSSGGPVMNAQGQVIGVATRSLTEGQNLNLAVPVRYLRPLLAAQQAPQRFAAHLVSAGQGRTAGSPPRQRPEAGDHWAEQATQQVTLMGQLLRAEYGMRLFQRLHSGALHAGEMDRHELQLTAGTRYMIIGACDEDCRDLDLGLQAGGALLVSDTEEDDTPIVEFTPARTGRYTLLSRMVRCGEEPCRFAVGVFSR